MCLEDWTFCLTLPVDYLNSKGQQLPRDIIRSLVTKGQQLANFSSLRKWITDLQVRIRTAAPRTFTLHFPLLGVAPSPRQLGVVLSPQKMVQSGSGSPGQLSPSRHSSGCLWTVNAIATRRKRNPSPQERLLDQVDALSDAAGQKVLLQLTGVGRRSNQVPLCGWFEKANISADKGAISVTNNHQNELFVETIVLQGLPFGTVYFGCYSWVQSKFRTARERIFFANKRYLPSETPPGLIDLRERNKASLRGKGTGTRKPWESVYDYDVYNDIGNPDKSIELSRPTIGGSRAFPYPRRCRTGRLPTKIDATAESVLAMNESYYVPRDEVFQEMKRETFKGKNLLGVVHQITPAMTKSLHESHEEFQSFQDIDRLYQEGIILRDFEHKDELLKVLNISQITHKIEASINYGAGIMQYAKPDILSKDHFAWLRDDEFGRQMLSGANPVQIQRLQEFPPKSSDLDAYGDSLSAFKDEHLAGRLEGLSVEEAINQERLFILDYHDAFLPFVNRVNELPGRKMYASRTILFLTGTGSLIPLAIELSLPEQKRVFTPGSDASSDWLWQLAKAHVSSNDAGFHQLVNHWLRSHAAVEPYIIATRRQLSSMHPLYVLLQLHFKCTLEINALARQLLINADGVIENCFTAGPFGLEISSAAYSSMWKFDQESLPNDLMRRGMAVKDPSQPHGIRLIIQDYPYGSDGLLIWDAITTWVEEYVSLFYKDSKSVEEDAELQAWWEEIRMVGHADKKDAEWWPSLRTTDNLKAILTTILWVVSGFHAAVNFAQYAYGGYVPNRPCMTRRLIPEEGSEEYREFLEDPERFFISMLPNVQQATTTMSVIDTLSSHSPDEEYLGERMQTNWTNNLAAQEAFKRFSQQMDLIEHIITLRNKDLSLNNRSGAGVLPYEILCPSSAPGTTSRGVPNSVSI
ncbi:hypothetical protein KP509_1Z127900 [Ceratopteris richardii]|nr:hypothetical protein KP509_1Z127900 [Ceratopteris richardii]